MATINGTSGNDDIDEIADGGDVNFSDEVFALGGDDIITIYENSPLEAGDPAVIDTVHGGGGTDTLRLALTNGFILGYSGTSGSVSGGDWLLNFDGIEKFDLTIGTEGEVSLGNGDDVVTVETNDEDVEVNTGGGADLASFILSGFFGGTDTANLGAGNDRLVVDYGATTGFVSMPQALSGSLATGYSGRFEIAGFGTSVTFSGVENFTVTTGSNVDELVTGDGNDVLSTGAGGDLITVGKGDDSIDGGANVDALSIDLSDESQGVAINLLLGGQQQSGGTGSIANVESFKGAVTGSAFNDVLIEGNQDYNAQFSTGAGNDLVQVSRGADTADLGSGNDRLVVDYGYATGSVFMSQALSGSLAAGYSGQFQGSGFGTSVTFSGVENFTVTTGANTDTIVTGDGNDVISTGAGGDTVTAGGGDDLVTGGLGDDTLNGGAGVDTASYADASAKVAVSLAVTTAQATGGAGSDTLTGFENLTGSGFGDTLTGDGAANAIAGGAGKDKLKGASGADNLEGGGGEDRLDGGKGGDLLTGGAGDDRLTGGLNADTFFFTDGAGSDDILDFSREEGDKIRIDAEGVSRFRDLTITSDDAGGSTVAFGSVTIGVAGIEPGDLAARDFVFGPIEAAPIEQAPLQAFAHGAIVTGEPMMFRFAAGVHPAAMVDLV